ncbi:hypothetical protein [Bradyrhizobium icense]|uniref:hypothetical protein n=1 Tax=Bradyrhizobium icense TaxID=1274631 RepID=UPI0012EA0A76|nr:hypothetical protein [Bradyrhizobium icense]
MIPVIAGSNPAALTNSIISPDFVHQCRALQADIRAAGRHVAIVLKSDLAAGRFWRRKEVVDVQTLGLAADWI